jgi:hypothetical protein
MNRPKPDLRILIRGAMMQARQLPIVCLRRDIQPESQRGLAEFTIGLGSNFIAGETVEVAIETNWGDYMPKAGE